MVGNQYLYKISINYLYINNLLTNFRKVAVKKSNDKKKEIKWWVKNEFLFGSFNYFTYLCKHNKTIKYYE